MSISELCRWTGMQRMGSIARVERWRTDDPGYNVRLDLGVDGRRKPSLVRFDSHRRLLSFQPDRPGLLTDALGLGCNTVHSPEARGPAIAAVNRLNRHLRWKWYGSPAVQKLGRNYLVTYLSIPPSDKGKHMYLDPYVSFIVTPKGTVFAAFFGS